MDEKKAGWRQVKFGEVVRQVKDKVDPGTSGLERFIAGEHMDTDDLRIRRWGDIGSGYLGPAFHMRFRPGHVLYGSRRTYLRKVAVPDFEGICANTTFVLETVSPQLLLQELLPYIMSTDAFHEHSKRESKGSVNPYVNFSDIAWYEFALPPLEEQNRMIKALRSMQAATDRIADLRSSGDQLLQSMSFALMKDTCSNVEYRCLGEMCIRQPQSGIYKPAEFLGTGVPLVQMGELFGNDAVSPELCASRIEVNADELSKFRVEEGDLLFGRRSIVLSGAGRCVLVDCVSEPTVFESSIIRLRTDSSRLMPQFLFEWLRSPLGAQSTNKIVTFTTVAGIKGSDLTKLRIPIPPMNRQRELRETMADTRASLAHTQQRARSMTTLASIARRVMLETFR